MNKKNINKLITVAAIIIAVIVFVPNLNFKSVKKYNEEQENLVSEQNSTEKNNGESLYDKVEDKSYYNKQEDDNSGYDDTSSLDKKKKNKNDKSTVKTGDKDTEKDNITKKEGSAKKGVTEKNKDDKKSDNNGSDKKLDNKTVKKSKSDKRIVKDNSKKDNGKKDNNSNKTDDKKDKNQDNKKDDDGEYITCNVSIDCTSVLDNLNMLKSSVKKHIPASGIILKESMIKVKIDANAYDVLVTACKLNKIAYDAEYSKAYSSTYVKGIGYLYEKMAGDMSGWLYLVNGKTANVGASRYMVNEGDTISWTYTCSGRAGS